MDIKERNMDLALLLQDAFTPHEKHIDGGFVSTGFVGKHEKLLPIDKHASSLADSISDSGGMLKIFTNDPEKIQLLKGIGLDEKTEEGASARVAPRVFFAINCDDTEHYEKFCRVLFKMRTDQIIASTARHIRENLTVAEEAINREARELQDKLGVAANAALVLAKSQLKIEAAGVVINSQKPAQGR